MQLIFLWIYLISSKVDYQVGDNQFETEVIPIQDDVVYNIQPDGRGGVAVKASDANGNNYTNNPTVGNNNLTNYNNSNAYDGQGRDYVIGYAPTPEEIAAQPYVPIYTVDEFQSLFQNSQPNYNNEVGYQGGKYAQNQGNYVQPNGNASMNGQIGTNYQGSPNGVIYVESSNGVASRSPPNGVVYVESPNRVATRGIPNEVIYVESPSKVIYVESPNERPLPVSTQGTPSNGATTRESNVGSGAAVAGESANTSEGANGKKSSSDSKNKKDKKNNKKKDKDSKKSERDSETVKSGVEKSLELLYMLLIIYLF